MPEFRLAGRRLEVSFAFVQHFVQAEVVIFINIPLQQTYPRLQKTSPRIGVVIAYRRELLSRSAYGVVIERVIFPKPLADIFPAAAFEGQDYSAPWRFPALRKERSWTEPTHRFSTFRLSRHQIRLI